MNDEFHPPRRSWPGKFRDAAIGAWRGVKGQCSFYVHLPAAGLVIAAGIVLKVDRIEWCLLALCITIVLAAEMFNSAIETIAKAIDRKYSPHLAEGLDIGSAAVLVAALGAVATGALILGYRFGVVVGWW